MKNEITKVNLIKTCNNDMQYCKYYMVYFKLYNEDKTRYYKMHFIMQIDMQDVQEYYEKDRITSKEWNDYKKEIAFTLVDNYNYNNIQKCCDYCNETIRNWNRGLAV